MDTSYHFTHVLCIAIAGQKVLLAQKQSGHGAGKWNGFGGKIHAGETPSEAAHRECMEEAGIEVTSLKPAGELLFKYADNEDSAYEHRVALFIIEAFKGSPVSTAEMGSPTWFSVNDIPYHGMWPDDATWLPLVLAGKRIRGTFSFDSNQDIVHHSISNY